MWMVLSITTLLFASFVFFIFGHSLVASDARVGDQQRETARWVAKELETESPIDRLQAIEGIENCARIGAGETSRCSCISSRRSARSPTLRFMRTSRPCRYKAADRWGDDFCPRLVAVWVPARPTTGGTSLFGS